MGWFLEKRPASILVRVLAAAGLALAAKAYDRRGSNWGTCVF
jgi:hypothetical protein